jgi:hypothetical protein
MSKVNGDHRSSYQVFLDLPPEEFETLKRAGSVGPLP